METISMVYKGSDIHLPLKKGKGRIRSLPAVERRHNIRFVRDTGRRLIFTFVPSGSFRLQNEGKDILANLDFVFHGAFRKKVVRQIVILQMQAGA